MKKLIVGLFAVAVAALVMGQAARPAEPNQVGRYQLLAATKETSARGEDKKVMTYETKTVFKLDTVTGKAWYFSDIRDKPENIDNRGWISIQD